MLISFIIPAYNASDTIVRCLDSIYKLSLIRDEFEVIVIDDASMDDTCDVVERYVRDVLCVNSDVCNSNLTLLRQLKNHRQGAARNRGVSVAKGDYICFVDADDTVTVGIIKALRLAKEKDSDMVALHYGNANEDGEVTSEAEYLSFTESQVFTGIQMQNFHPYWCSAPWAFIYNKEFLQRIDYPFAEGVLFEDSDFVAVHLYYAQKICYSRELGYIAIYREGSTTRSTSYKNLVDYILLGTRMLALYDRIIGERVNDVENESVSMFAEGILEGACFNVERSCRRLFKLGSQKEVRAYYDRLDAHVKRNDLCKEERLKKYYWNAWTALCLAHKNVAIAILICVFPIFRMLTRIKK